MLRVWLEGEHGVVEFMSENGLHTIAIDLISSDRQTLPDRLGRALHAQVMQWLERGDRERARIVHDASPTPFSLSPLQTRSRQLQPGDRATLVVGLLDATLLQTLFFGLQAWDRDPCVLAAMHFQIETVRAVPGDRPEVKATTYEELAAGEPLGADIELHFRSPTSFKQRHGIQTFPLPELVFESLRRRWNAFAPESVRIPDIDWMGWVAAYDLKTVAWKGKGGVEIGAIGWVRYRFAEAGVRQPAGTLARFAEFAGVGRKTAQGFGRTELRVGAGRSPGGKAVSAIAAGRGKPVKPKNPTV